MGKLLVLGGSGMVGSKFVEKYSGELELLTPGIGELDLTVRESVGRYIDQRPEIEVVVNFAAFTNVSASQQEKGDESGWCWKINVVGAQNLAAAVSGKKIFLVQISTDMVFAGDEQDPGPYEERHEKKLDKERLTWYGYTKLKAEQELETELGNKLAILRIIYPVGEYFAGKADYLRGPLNYFEKNGSLYSIFDDQQMNISDIEEVVQAIEMIIDKRMPGIMHAGSSNLATPYLIMKKLFELTQGKSLMVVPGRVDGKRYPKFGGLLNEETQIKLGMKFSSWERIVEKLYKK